MPEQLTNPEIIKSRLDMDLKRFAKVQREFCDLLIANYYEQEFGSKESDEEKARKQRFRDAVKKSRCMEWSSRENMEGSLYIQYQGNLIRYRGYKNAHIYVNGQDNFVEANEGALAVRRINNKTIFGEPNFSAGTVPTANKNDLIDHSFWAWGRQTFNQVAKDYENKPGLLTRGILDRLRRKKEPTPLPDEEEEPVVETGEVPLERYLEVIEIINGGLQQATFNLKAVLASMNSNGPYR